VNYGQNLNLIHGLETMVCMAIEGAMQIEGGNWRIFSGMLNAANASVHLNTTVSSISRSQTKYSVKTNTQDVLSGEVFTNEEPFDTVILAAPLQFSNLKIAPGLLKHTPDKIPYVALHVTLFASPHPLDRAYFNLGPKDEVPSSILTTLPLGETPQKPEESAGSPGFFSISTLRRVINPETLEREYLYKIFSPKAVTPDFLSGILGAEGISSCN
jgi:prenylcysteine oxidase/farnesylcysteine lyase